MILDFELPTDDDLLQLTHGVTISPLNEHAVKSENRKELTRDEQAKLNEVAAASKKWEIRDEGVFSYM
ncbi:hypothetical protein JCM5353_004225, partial [Sporobolomyces roseus]